MGFAKRFILATVALLLYMAAWIYPLLYVVKHFGEDKLEVIVLVGFSVIAGLMLPFMDWCAKHIFYFKGEGATVSEDDLRKEILSINYHDLPVVVKEKGTKLIVTWKYLDAKWWEIMSKQGMKQAFSVTLRFDDKHKRVTMLDTASSVSWGVGVNEARVGFSLFRGIYLNYEIGKAWGVRENFTVGKLYDYKFNSSEIHNPLMNTILRSGWDVRFGLF